MNLIIRNISSRYFYYDNNIFKINNIRRKQTVNLNYCRILLFCVKYTKKLTDALEKA